ncbi:triose-phosphate isomerase [Azospirillum sp.]|uniref:triose-phosphate isomerase n=1 Tax=Azospirillum sp. TaxID=34012 RepID=UPI002D3F4995|nr:triose-phosphate isomerase [Azospirillum sp.]HYD64691.1 triose-phosphate isomerase [Azospirillum sp.]
MAARRKLIAGNWKMNGLKADGLALASDLAGRVKGAGAVPFDMLVCPPFPLLFPVGDAVKGSGVALGAQDCHAKQKGAHTGDVSPVMLKDAGCAYVILGHSERRADHGESDAVVNAKTVAAHKEGLIAIVCVGETEAQRDAGTQTDVVGSQLAGSLPEGTTAENTVVAYEPVWAIGTGKTATPDDVAAMHAFIRGELAKRFPDADKMRVLYGGSVKPSNAAELMATENVDGALVGGASLVADDFWAIATSCR